MNPQFSVVIPTYNRLSFLKEAIQSVFDQSFTDYELIIIDDASTDGTLDYLNTIQSAKLHVYRHKENKGVSASRNLGITKSSADYIAFLDSDDLWHREKLQKQYNFFQENPTYKLCHSNERWLLNGKHLNQRKIHRKTGGFFFERATELCLVSPSSAVLHSSLFKEFGCFDESLAVCEDYDLWLRLNSQLPFGFIDDDLVIKRGGHSDQLSKSLVAMDRYRIQSMMGLYKSKSLHPEQEKVLLKTLTKKLAILEQGALKHGNNELLNFCKEIRNILAKKSSSLGNNDS